jgi:RNA polymerase sigma factor (sigma-70 family)
LSNIADEQQKEDWLKLLVSGDHCAFAEFVKRYQKSVFLCCHLLGLNENESEDVANETFLAAYQKIGNFGGMSKLETWLWGITYHKAMDYLRRKGRCKELFSDFDEQPADAGKNHIANGLEHREQSDLVWRMVNRLPKLWALSIVLFYREEKSISEISQIMKKNKNTVKTYLFRSRERLKRLLEGSFGESIYVDK